MTNTFFYIAEVKIETAMENYELHQLLFKLLHSKCKYPVWSKFNDLNDIMNNCFLTEAHKSDYLQIFGDIQRAYRSLSRLAYIYKYKKAKINVTHDLCLNAISEGSPNIICIMDKQKRYLFSVKELAMIVNTSLSSSCFFFSSPVNVKNPYTNMPFNKSTLYNIYFYIRFKTMTYPSMLFQKFFECNFNIKLFTIKYEYLIRDYLIDEHIRTSTEDALSEEIYYMLDVMNEKNEDKQILVDDDFPKTRLVEIMRPYLSLWISCVYSSVQNVRQYNYGRLTRKLTQFYDYNPRFGHRIFRVVHDTVQFRKSRVLIEFDDKHVNFNNQPNNMNQRRFMTNHLTK